MDSSTELNTELLTALESLVQAIQFTPLGLPALYQLNLSRAAIVKAKAALTTESTP